MLFFSSTITTFSYAEGVPNWYNILLAQYGAPPLPTTPLIVIAPKGDHGHLKWNEQWANVGATASVCGTSKGDVKITNYAIAGNDDASQVCPKAVAQATSG